MGGGFRKSAVRLVLWLALAVRTAASAAPESGSPELQEALRVSSFGRFEEAKRRLAAIAFSPGAAQEDRDKAGEELARIAWRIDGEPGAARARLSALALRAAKKVPPLLLLSRMERSLGRFEAARAAARGALAVAETKSDRRSATVALALVLVEEEVAAGRQGKASAFEGPGRERAAEARGLLLPIVRDEPGDLASSLALLDAALLLDDGPAALAGWSSYFMAAGTADSVLLAGPRAALGELLPGWPGPAAAGADRRRLVEALAGSRLFAEAVIVARDPRSPMPSGSDAYVKDLVRYERFLRSVRDRTDRYYRDIACGRDGAAAWKAWLHKETRALWKDLSWIPTAPPFDDKIFEGGPDTPLGTRFGTVLNGGGGGTTGGVEDLHMGHRVLDERRTVDQYGRKAVLRFIALDTIVSNGYESWMWDGNGSHGGWGRIGLIVQVRPSYAGGASFYWEELNDPERRAKQDRWIAEESARDDERAAKDPYAWLPGLSRRIGREGLLEIFDALKAKGLSGAALRAAFAAACDRSVIESSIFAHEGRHAIDAEFEKIEDGGEREYRAKLSELAFAPAPRLAFGGILSDNIGNPTPHGRANLKLMKGLVGWMEAHRGDIESLDPGQPLLPQLDRLTDDQIRAAARSLDPMAATTADGP